MGQFDDILATHGKDVTWMQHQSDGTYLNMGTKKAIIWPARATEVLIEPGYAEDSYQNVCSSQVFAQLDQLVFDSETWEVQTLQKWENQTLGELFYQSVIRRRKT